MTDPWADMPNTQDPGFDGQWADLSFLDEETFDPELAEALDFMSGEGREPAPPYGSPERALYDWTR